MDLHGWPISKANTQSQRQFDSVSLSARSLFPFFETISFRFEHGLASNTLASTLWRCIFCLWSIGLDLGCYTTQENTFFDELLWIHTKFGKQTDFIHEYTLHTHILTVCKFSTRNYTELHFVLAGIILWVKVFEWYSNLYRIVFGSSFYFNGSLLRNSVFGLSN